MKKLDTIFSQYIRLRDTDENGYGQCITCGKTFAYDELECGHFRHRRHQGTRWHEMNAHAQCFTCNRGDDMVQYIVAILEKYKEKEVNKMIRLSMMVDKFTQAELNDTYAYYRRKAQELLKDKMFKVNL